jgi:hypothetical protein
MDSTFPTGSEAARETAGVKDVTRKSNNIRAFQFDLPFSR